ncbi:hypothetical protein SAMN05660971_03185 [Halomonas cupida]|uniref:Uncharacterized protein n=1 Tax=Halomonas cupida TaxID=44933 RepID=A0A1M7JIP4_9GAMM|nr:hypothetical protein SAMN05660971_03185 [Halomonas cupida]
MHVDPRQSARQHEPQGADPTTKKGKGEADAEHETEQATTRPTTPDQRNKDARPHPDATNNKGSPAEFSRPQTGQGSHEGKNRDRHVSHGDTTQEQQRPLDRRTHKAPTHKTPPQQTVMPKHDEPKHEPAPAHAPIEANRPDRDEEEQDTAPQTHARAKVGQRSQRRHKAPDAKATDRKAQQASTPPSQTGRPREHEHHPKQEDTTRRQREPRALKQKGLPCRQTDRTSDATRPRHQQPASSHENPTKPVQQRKHRQHTTTPHSVPPPSNNPHHHDGNQPQNNESRPLPHPSKKQDEAKQSRRTPNQ